MKSDSTYENYPLPFVIAANLVTLPIYFLGMVVLWQLGWVVAGLFILYCLGLELRLLKNSCVNCYYYGKRCFSGRAALSALLFKKGDPQKFACKTFNWTQMIPDFLVVLIPLVVGLILSFIDFNWPRLGIMLLLIILGFPVTGYIRGNLACKYCRQRELGCPANKLFGG